MRVTASNDGVQNPRRVCLILKLKRGTWLQSLWEDYSVQCPSLLTRMTPVFVEMPVGVHPLTMAEAKKGLAMTFNVAPEAIEIVIRGSILSRVAVL
jgi:hypothetical protein